MVESKYNNVVAYTVSYNGDGAISKVVDNRSGITAEYEYDSLGRLIFAIEYETSSKTVVLETENKYDSFGRPLGSSYDLPDIDIGYSVDYKDNSNLIEGFLQHNSSDMELNGKFYTYDALERLTGVRVVMDGLTVYTESYTYVSGNGRTSSLVATHTVDGATYSYTYDDVGNITSVSENGTLRASYYYDSLGQLGQASYYSDRYYSEGYYDAYEYFYDKSGNITNAYHHYGPDVLYSDSKTYTYSNTSWGDLLTSFNGTAITYDTIGNPLKWRNATNIEWYGRQLSIFASPDGAFSCYGYNADGIRTSKTIYGADGNLAGTVKYTLDGSTIVAENRNGTNIYYTYDDKGSIMGMIYGGETYMFSKNLQGDVIGIYNENRQLVAKYQYNAFGEITAITDANGVDVSTNATHIANINPFRYRGYYYDTETGLYYLITRYYDPVVGRFLSADAFVSTGQGILGNNMFAYCLNGPVMRYDPYGNCSICERGAYGPCSDLANNSNGECSCYKCSLYRSMFYGSPFNYICQLKMKGQPNGMAELYKGGRLIQRRWYDSDGLPYLDRDYTDHGNSKRHPLVPHDHDWHDNDKGERKRDEEWHEPRINLDDDDNDVAEDVAYGVGIGIAAYATYAVVKWAVAFVFAVPTSGSSLIIAGATP